MQKQRDIWLKKNVLFIACEWTQSK